MGRFNVDSWLIRTLECLDVRLKFREILVYSLGLHVFCSSRSSGSNERSHG